MNFYIEKFAMKKNHIVNSGHSDPRVSKLEIRLRRCEEFNTGINYVPRLG